MILSQNDFEIFLPELSPEQIKALYALFAKIDQDARVDENQRRLDRMKAKTPPNIDTQLNEIERMIYELAYDHIAEFGIQQELPKIMKALKTLIAKARVEEIHKFINRLDSISEEKYAVRRIKELNHE